MEYKKSKESFYIRMDKGEEVFSVIKDFCKKENILSGHFQGIGGCDNATVATLNADTMVFTDHNVSGRVIEMVSLLGNVSCDEKRDRHIHAHASFSYINDDNKPDMIAGHLKEANIAFTGEIIFTPSEFVIGRKFDEKAGIEVWDLN